MAREDPLLVGIRTIADADGTWWVSCKVPCDYVRGQRPRKPKAIQVGDQPSVRLWAQRHRQDHPDHDERWLKRVAIKAEEEARMRRIFGASASR